MAAADPGIQVLNTVFEWMRIDDQWSLREPRGFTWWGHELAQRVWVEPPRLSYDVWVSKVHAVTDVLRHTDASESGTKTLAALNMHASLSAFVPHPGDGHVRLHCTAYVHEGNVGWLCPLFASAVAIQAADADLKARFLPDFMTGEPDTSAHPVSGRREAADEMLDVLGDLFVPVGSGPSPFTEADFAATLRAKPHPWVLATGGGAGMTAEFAYTGSAPALDAVRRGAPLQTALFHASAAERHPQLGSGALLRLHLPAVTEPDAVTVANALNRAEAEEWTGIDLLGAWCPEPAGGVAFISFLPAAIYLPGLLDQFVWMMALRSRWACAYLERAAKPKGGRYRAPLESS